MDQQRNINGSHGLYHGEIMRLNDLVYGMMIPYSAAYVIPGFLYHRRVHGIFQPRMIVQQDYGYAYVLDDHFILHQHNIINPILTRIREIEATRRRYHNSVDRNQPRVSTQQDASSAYAYIQDGHFILHESISQVNHHVPTRRRDVNATQRLSYANLERVIIQKGMIDSEAMTCSICLEELPVGSKAIRLPSPCSHVFHEYCIVKWLDTSSTCPLCRRVVS